LVPETFSEAKNTYRTQKLHLASNKTITNNRQHVLPPAWSILSHYSVLRMWVESAWNLPLAEALTDESANHYFDGLRKDSAKLTQPNAA